MVVVVTQGLVPTRSNAKGVWMRGAIVRTLVIYTRANCATCVAVVVSICLDTGNSFLGAPRATTSGRGEGGGREKRGF